MQTCKQCGALTDRSEADETPDAPRCCAEPLVAVLREIYNNVPRVTYVLEQPSGFPAPHYDIWLHDLIDLALKNWERV